MMNKDYSIESRPSESAVACYDKTYGRTDVGSNSEDESGASLVSMASDSSIKVKEEDVKIQRKRVSTDVVDINVEGNGNIVVYTDAPLTDDAVKAIQRLVADAHNRHDSDARD